MHINMIWYDARKRKSKMKTSCIMVEINGYSYGSALGSIKIQNILEATSYSFHGERDMDEVLNR